MTRMSDARSRRRFERKQKQKLPSIPLMISFRDVGMEFKQRVVLFYTEKGDPSDDDIIAELPIRGELPMERKEEIVEKFVSLFTACIVQPSESVADVEVWRGDGSMLEIFEKSKGARNVASDETDAPRDPREMENFWPSFQDPKGEQKE